MRQSGARVAPVGRIAAGGAPAMRRHGDNRLCRVTSTLFFINSAATATVAGTFRNISGNTRQSRKRCGFAIYPRVFRICPNWHPAITEDCLGEPKRCPNPVSRRDGGVRQAWNTQQASRPGSTADRLGPEGRESVSAIKVLFVTSEVAGLAKAGGLGEVSAGLPQALSQRGVDVRILMPAYQEVIAKLPAIDWSGELPGRAAIPAGRLGQALLPDGMILYLVDAPSLFNRRGTPYCSPEGADWQDNHLRFARLSLAADDIAGGRADLDWTPDIVHANDWPGGLTPAYMRWDGTRVPTVLTIHNIAYQGNFAAG